MYSLVWRGENSWAVIFIPEARETHVALATTRADAEKIAKALNEAEGL